MTESTRDPSSRPRRTPTLLLNAQYLPTSHDWRTPQGRAHSPFDVDTFIRQAQQAEDAGFDAIFQADFSGVNREGLRSGPPLSAFEPFQMSALVASATSRIAVMPTVSTLYTHPFTFARNLASLDRIAGGRAWVNVVSSFRGGTAIGITRDIDRQNRHLQTEEFLALARSLWESWPPRANVVDAVGGRFIRDDLVTDVEHSGQFYEQHGPIDTAPYSPEFPFTLQATSSLEGLRLAARTADAVFVGTPTIGAAQQLRRILRAEVKRAGRGEDSVALLPGAFVHILDESVGGKEWSARPQVLQLPGAHAALGQLRSRYPGLRLRGVGPSDPLPADVIDDDPDVVFETLGSHYLPLWDIARKPGQSVADFAVAVASLGEHARFVGTAEQVGEELRRWYDEGGVDGFQFILGNRFETVCDRVVPRLLGVG